MNQTPTSLTAHQAKARFRGCLLGGAVGDALGAPIEFMDRPGILHQFGPEGLGDYAPAYGGLGRITDDTQMTLFTAEGLLSGWQQQLDDLRPQVAQAYLRWLYSQGMQPAKPELRQSLQANHGLLGHQALHSRRAPGNTCLSALLAMTDLTAKARNDSKGCGGVMRVAPVGLFAWRLQLSPAQCFDLAADCAALTHGHPTGFLTAGVLAVLIQQLLSGFSLRDALSLCLPLLIQQPHHQQTLAALQQAQTLADTDLAAEQAISQLGEGWIAEEALAIGLYCALIAKDFEHGMRLAINHRGDSDSTGSIYGNLLGARDGETLIPERWLQPLELHSVIIELAEQLYDFVDWPQQHDSDPASPADLSHPYPIQY